MPICPTLNKGQLEAVTSDSSKILCLAGAGTGKTFCMIERINRLVEEGVTPSSILVLTFTNAAAFEMKARYQKLHPGTGNIPEFRTFHSFCFSLIASNVAIRSYLGYSDTPNIASESDIKQITTTASMQTGIHLQVDRRGKINPDKLSMKEKGKYEILKKAVHRILRQRNLISFDTLCYGVCELFVSNDERVKRYKDRFKYVFVDEFQDTDKAQWDFIRSFSDSNLFVVGDALQAIYGFRGANSDIIKSLSRNLEWTIVRLEENYRSSKSICDYANSMSHYADGDYRVEIVSSKSGPDVIETDDVYNRGEIDSNIVQKCFEQHLKCGGCSAFLVRTNAEVSSICSYFDKKGISYTTGHRNVEALRVLQSAADNSFFLEWLTSCLNAEQYAAYIRMSTFVALETLGEYTIQQFVSEFGQLPVISRKIMTVVNVRNVFRSDLSIREKRDEVLKLVDVTLPVPPEVTDDMSSKECIEKIIDCMSLSHDDGLYIGTIHSSKGLEYDNVFLLGVDGPSFKLNSEESKNLYYVGITRAKTHLYISVGSDN